MPQKRVNRCRFGRFIYFIAVKSYFQNKCAWILQRAIEIWLYCTHQSAKVNGGESSRQF
jgi:hypothetical protein